MRTEVYLSFNTEESAKFFAKRVKQELGLTMYFRKTTDAGEPINE